MKTTYAQCKQIRVFWSLSHLDRIKSRRPFRIIHGVFTESQFDRHELEFILTYLDANYVFDVQELVDGIGEEQYAKIYASVQELWAEFEGMDWPYFYNPRRQKMQYLIHMSPVFAELNAYEAEEPHIKTLINYIKTHALYNHLPKVVFHSEELIGFLELANFECSVGITLCSGLVHSSHSMFLEPERPEFVFDSLLDDFPEDMENIDEYYEETKELKTDWIAKYAESVWMLDSLEDLLAGAQPL